jgi:hypothetical protein
MYVIDFNPQHLNPKSIKHNKNKYLRRVEVIKDDNPKTIDDNPNRTQATNDRRRIYKPALPNRHRSANFGPD